MEMNRAGQGRADQITFNMCPMGQTGRQVDRQTDRRPLLYRFPLDAVSVINLKLLFIDKNNFKYTDVTEYCNLFPV